MKVSTKHARMRGLTVTFGSMFAYQLLAHLQHLQLCGQEPDGELQWLGNSEQWQAKGLQVEQYEV